MSVESKQDDFHQSTVTEWEHFLPKHDRLTIEQVEQNMQALHIQPLLRYLSPNSLVVEAGCGYGQWVYAFRTIGHSCIGLDFSHSILLAAQKRGRGIELLKPSRGWIQGDILSLPFKDETLDCYLSFGVLEHFKYPVQKQIVGEVSRVLKPGGIFYLYVPYFWSLWTIRRQLRYWYRKIFPPQSIWQQNMRKARILKLCNEAQFSKLELESVYAEKALQAAFGMRPSVVRCFPTCVRRFATKTAHTLGTWLDQNGQMGYGLVYVGEKHAPRISTQGPVR